MKSALLERTISYVKSVTKFDYFYALVEIECTSKGVVKRSFIKSVIYTWERGYIETMLTPLSVARSGCTSRRIQVELMAAAAGQPPPESGSPPP